MSFWDSFLNSLQGGGGGGPVPGTSLTGVGGQGVVPNPGAALPYTGDLPSGTQPMPGSGVIPRHGVTPGQPSMGFPSLGDGASSLMSLLGGGNPYWRAAIAGAGAMQPTPTANDAAPTNPWFGRPSGQGGMPGPQVNTPPPQNFVRPGAPQVGGLPAATPVQNFVRPEPPAATPIQNFVRPPAPVAVGNAWNQRPSGRPDPAPAAAAVAANPASRFVQVDRPNMPANNGSRGGGPQKMTALDLSGLFNRAPQQAAPNIQGPMAALAANPPWPPPRPPNLGA